MTEQASQADRRFADRLFDAVRRAGTPACVGLDPVLERLPRVAAGSDPVASIEAFCEGVIAASAGIVPVVKFQSACFERYGGAGVGLLGRLIQQARQAGLVVILDAKRGDIGITNEHYAAAIAGLGADAVTLSGYLGTAEVEPYLKAGLGIFVLVRTSNPDSDEIQSQRLADGRTVAELVADRVAALGDRWRGFSGYSDVGAVVGATKTADGRELRRRMPHQVFLVPGYGAQGGMLDDVRKLVDEKGRGVLITASRSVIYAFRSAQWVEEIRGAAMSFASEVRSLAR